jgi:hypothetical protein
MTDAVAGDSAETRRLLDRVRAGDAAAFDALFERHRAVLGGYLDNRIDDRLRAPARPVRRGPGDAHGGVPPARRLPRPPAHAVPGGVELQAGRNVVYITIELPPEPPIPRPMIRIRLRVVFDVTREPWGLRHRTTARSLGKCPS